MTVAHMWYNVNIVDVDTTEDQSGAKNETESDGYKVTSFPVNLENNLKMHFRKI